MPREKREVDAGLLNKGFEQRAGDHNYFVYVSESGKKSTARTKTSHGRGFDVDDNLLSQMARQCGLTKKLFLDLLDCPLKRPEYEKLLKSAGKL
jgi:hypothetical protein